MLPAHLAENIRKQVLFYLQSTFSFRNKNVEKAFNRFIEDPLKGIFKGPWINLKRPFKQAPLDVELPLNIDLPFHPFLHQYHSWNRLSSKDQKPESTLITTGTGSGKTECFLYPVLDHCLRKKQEGQQGIKAIVLYPMNALAADQEKRFAKAVWNNEELKKANIRIGNYTGRYDVASKSGIDNGQKEMGPEHGISHHGVQQDNPPDILLTNYRMLDFLLMRPQDQNLWRFNEEGVLQYLVLDELHTYDGAQGADVACLIRRLKEHLHVKKGSLCVVGTSATLENKDSGSEFVPGSTDSAYTSKDKLANFAGILFEEDIQGDAVIGETRRDVEEIVDVSDKDTFFPLPEECGPLPEEDAFLYSIRQARLWHAPEFEYTGNDEDEKTRAIEQWGVGLGNWLKRNSLFRSILILFQKHEGNKSKALTYIEVVNKLKGFEPTIQKYSHDDLTIILSSFFALIDYSKEQYNTIALPLVPTQVQLWIRELRRIGRIVNDINSSAFMWLDEPVPGKRALPAFHCSECGESGWIALHDLSKDSLIQSRGVRGFLLKDDPTSIYRAWFGSGNKSSEIVIISPGHIKESDIDPIQGLQNELPTEQWFIHPKSLVVRQGKGNCPLTEEITSFRIKINQNTRTIGKSGKVVGDQGCPSCGSKTGIFFIGTQASTMSSVAIDEMFGSLLNNDPKLLAFTDSVQDASHRAGFFTARTYRFTFRTALQHCIDDTGNNGLPLKDIGEHIINYWSQNETGRFGSIKETLTSLIPPDLQHYSDFLNYRNTNGSDKPPVQLYKELTDRLSWEAVSEFGLMKMHGRTLEWNGSAVLGFDKEIVTATIKELMIRSTAIDPDLEKISENTFYIWLQGLLMRYRERGALYHPYLESYAKQNFWGKTPFGRSVPGRETCPSITRYKPKLLTDKYDADHETLIVNSLTSNRLPWHIMWSQRTLGKNIDITAINDLLNQLLVSGTKTGLLLRIHTAGDKNYYVINSDAARLYSESTHLVCSESEQSLMCQKDDASLWELSPSMDYFAQNGKYAITEFYPRHKYYHNRYRKGAVRRVVASEHTGLLNTEEREHLEKTFSHAEHRDDPNILTCTSTLEMGIDIGDLSSTMLCSIPPSTASYLQRIGRAGRATGTALIVSIINQRPHDLFFYSRPDEMIKGEINPPGCWLDASAVLVRQYFGYCLDCASKRGIHKEIPGNCNKLIEELDAAKGNVPELLAWISQNEDDLKNTFIQRFRSRVQDDTLERFNEETKADLFNNKIHQIANEYNQIIQDNQRTIQSLQSELKSLSDEESEEKNELEQEIKILKSRKSNLDRTSTLEVLTNHGLLPNYAFPESGVGFFGAVYNKNRNDTQESRPIEVMRPAGQAIRELAPYNYFYTHNRQFEIQQVYVGSIHEPIIEKWAVCGKCGHMKSLDDVTSQVTLNCPQCGHSEGSNSQKDGGQQRDFIEFSRSQAVSYMENYESISGDRDEDRQKIYYQTIKSFDQTVNAPSGAVGDDHLPFGIEYRASMIMREINSGYYGDEGIVAFSTEVSMPEGYKICKHCGIVSPQGGELKPEKHRRSCKGRKEYLKNKQKEIVGNTFEWYDAYLYRELKSEAIRLLLPMIDDEDIETLVAALHLGLRLRFQGNPANLIISPQILPDDNSMLSEKKYLVLMDAVPGGTGYLKTLYQEQDTNGLEGYGIVDVMKRSLHALETCTCQNLNNLDSHDDPDGCYRCLRTYHLQYNAKKISRNRGIVLLKDLIEASERRVQKEALDDIKPDSLFESILERRFVSALESYIRNNKKGKWEKTIIKGSQGFRFSLPDSSMIWELELQPSIGKAQGVAVQCKPDFLLSCDDPTVKSMAIFTDGYEYHCSIEHNRLSDDFKKRNSLLKSENFYVWNITWNDIEESSNQLHVCNSALAQLLEKQSIALGSNGINMPSAMKALGNGFYQLKAFIERPEIQGWALLAQLTAFYPLQTLMLKGLIQNDELIRILELWKTGNDTYEIEIDESGDIIYYDSLGTEKDFCCFIRQDDVLNNKPDEVIILGRINDEESIMSDAETFNLRWRKFLSSLNLFQFSKTFEFWTTSQCEGPDQPDPPLLANQTSSREWLSIIENSVSSLSTLIKAMSIQNFPLPEVEFYDETVDPDACAELAWPNLDRPFVILVGDQEMYLKAWHQAGYNYITFSDINAKGLQWTVESCKNYL